MIKYNLTQLNPDINFEKHVYHRDMFAHYLRWTHVLKRLKIGMNILDFGCGGGFLLSNLVCDNKIGIEINEIARLHCISQGINCYNNIDLIDDNSIDVIISSHCLEHTLSPHFYISNFKKN